MSLIARMQKNDATAKDELVKTHGPALVACAKGLGANLDAKALAEIVWEASVSFTKGPSDLAYALWRICEQLQRHDDDALAADPKLVASIAARVKLKIADKSETELLLQLVEAKDARAIADKVSKAIEAALTVR